MVFHKIYQMRINLLAIYMILFMSQKTYRHWHWHYEEKYQTVGNIRQLSNPRLKHESLIPYPQFVEVTEETWPPIMSPKISLKIQVFTHEQSLLEMTQGHPKPTEQNCTLSSSLEHLCLYQDLRRTTVILLVSYRSILLRVIIVKQKYYHEL